jgi:peptide deformylase
MARLPVLTVAEPRELAVLKQPSAPVAAIDDDLRRLMDDMAETMYAEFGIGIAAPQVGVLQRVVVMDLKSGEEGERNPRFFVNPEITWKSEETAVADEGCLSIPNVFDQVERPAKVRFKYLDREGAEREEEAEGLLAVCMQHEIDHLNGVLFIDYLSRLKRERAITRVKRERRAA